ncbi:MAG: acyl-CoA dehydrogenase family protein, partial [Caulobacteraceae bacterium]
MPLILTDEQRMLRETAAGLLDDKSPVAELRRLRDTRDESGFSRDLWRAFAEMGLAGALVPEAHGGVGLGFVEAGVVMEEIGRRLAPSPFLSTAVLTVTAFMRGGSAGHQAEWLPKIAAGEAIGALAVDEGGRHDPRKTALSAERSGNGFKLNGAKAFVVDGHAADLLIVAARTAGSPGETEGLTLFLVDPKASGVTPERTVMVDAHNAARITFDNVEVDADAVLGEVDGGWKLLDGLLDVGRAAVAAEQIGVGGEAFDRTVSSLKERKQFGKLIGEFQALQHRAAHLYAELEVARAATLKALQTLDEAPAMAPIRVSAAKAKAGQASLLAVQEGVQLHGGIGMTDEFEIGYFMKRQRVSAELFGD